MNKKVIEVIVEEVDAILSSPITAKGLDEALLIGSDTRTEIKNLLKNYLAEAPEAQPLVHQTRRR